MKALKRIKQQACCLCCCRYVLVLRSFQTNDPFIRGKWVIVDRQKNKIVQELDGASNYDAEYVLKLYKKYGDKYDLL